MNLSDLGWNPYFEAFFEPYRGKGLVPARVSQEHRTLYHILGEDGDLIAEVTGKLRHEAESRADFPAVGDWVAVARRENEQAATIHALLPRRSGFTRKAVLSGGMPETGGRVDGQVVAANVDTVFLVSGLDLDFNVRRIERYITMSWDSGAAPVVILNKADICEDIDEKVAAVEQVAIGAPILPLSAEQETGLDQLDMYLKPGATVAFLGSSGVGKSTLINRLLGEDRIKTQQVRAYDSHGRHTTTYRELYVLPGRGIVIDTPGMRQIQMWTDEEGLSRSFEDIIALIGQCRFSDCRHIDEPGCAIREGLENGTLDAGRWKGFVKMQKEVNFLEARKDEKTYRRTLRDWHKRIHQIQAQREDLRKKGLL
ncbi:MAG: ribosome small subunit-dependent GTPase A [candidate division Zixibacteria bacterium]|nr:ribosome small subunit-dependent GTPase A [candidate division Zixibacteria bacterium]